MADTKQYANSYIDPSDNQRRYFQDLEATHMADASDPSTILGAIKATADNTKTDLSNLCLMRFYATNAAAFHDNPWGLKTFLVMVRDPTSNMFSVHIISATFWPYGPGVVYFHTLYGSFLSVYKGSDYLYFRADGKEISILAFGSSRYGYFLKYEGTFDDLSPITPV